MIQKPKGTVDILPGQVDVWQFVEETAKAILDRYRYFEIRTPMFESYDLFARGVGETTDVVSKEMYDFYDKGDRHIALKPEGTAAVVRAFIEHKLYAPEEAKPYKVFYLSPMFRYERPQGGRQRQFNQLGVEVFGNANANTDVEVISLAWDILTSLGIHNKKLVINSLGTPDTRLAYRQALIDYLEPHFDQLSKDSQTRLHKNPLRVLDSKAPQDQELVKGAPSILAYLSEASKARFDMVQAMLDDLGIPYEIDANMVRGLDYYQDTIFEIMPLGDDLNAQATICGGGSYDGLVSQLSDGKQEVPGCGFAIGLERLILTMADQDVQVPEMHPLDIYVVNIGEETDRYAMKVLHQLRQAGYTADRDFLMRKAKRQFKEADKQGADLVITIGGQEIADQVVQIKNMASGKEETVAYADLAADPRPIIEAIKGDNK
ncbi:histidyl-tRNA synthetase [Aerococcus urinaehominis]|uniref:histidine--tRNA ligase n=1 Tax=Aerococcus urinaehominis TaxID=128944 RepID=UPI00088ADE24|nr:histidine--tRNA ligase [Aerococcus urinaehominis]SDL79952.1 histidyl-tRNA synthetase [Aerococcus urinaehominis]